MKKNQPPRADLEQADELRPEYRFDYRKARPNRFADEASHECIVVELEPDVSKVFSDSESVNRALRALISAMPAKTAPAHRGAAGKTSKPRRLRKSS